MPSVPVLHLQPYAVQYSTVRSRRQKKHTSTPTEPDMVPHLGTRSWNTDLSRYQYCTFIMIPGAQVTPLTSLRHTLRELEGYFTRAQVPKYRAGFISFRLDHPQPASRLYTESPLLIG